MNDGGPHRERSTARKGSRRSRVAADRDEDWALLPGLFSWSEVCSLFDAGSGRDREWRFAIRRVSTDETLGPLYTVRAAYRRAGNDDDGKNP